MSAPLTPTTPPASTVGNAVAQATFAPLVAVVDFHHARGPELEMWFGVDEGRDPVVEYDWALLPFMALSDGAHASTEDFSYFTLLRPATRDAPATSLFGISCTRQMDASQLLHRPADVTRSTVQKAVVVIADSPQHFGMLRERLSVVTSAWFAQREFANTDILRHFRESLADRSGGLLHAAGEDRDQYFGTNLRELVHEFKWQTLVLLKCCLLQPKMLFFGSRCERLCMMQFALVSLIPGLLRNLQDSAGPDLHKYEQNLAKPTSLRTSDRTSLLSYMGLPLQIFGKGSLFGPYTPLQQLDILADVGTKSYIVGSTNSLLLQQKDRYSDILINLDDLSVNITSTSLRTALQLSAADRRWIDLITQNVHDTWDKDNPGRPRTLGYIGSQEFIRLQFEEYLLSMISSVKYHNYLQKHAHTPRMALPHIEGDPALDFGSEWVEAWSHTENYRLWDANTDTHVFDMVEPKHPCAGAMTIDDLQRRFAAQMQELHLDERLAQGREVLGRNFAAGRDKASTLFNKLYADMEAKREAQKRRADEARAKAPESDQNGAAAAGGGVDLARAQQTMHTVGLKAGAYMNSWAQWAGEKRKSAWARPAAASTLTGGGWASGWGRTKSPTPSTTASENGAGGEYKEPALGAAKRMRSPRMSTSSARSAATNASHEERLLTDAPRSETGFEVEDAREAQDADGRTASPVSPGNGSQHMALSAGLGGVAEEDEKKAVVVEANEDEAQVPSPLVAQAASEPRA